MYSLLCTTFCAEKQVSHVYTKKKKKNLVPLVEKSKFLLFEIKQLIWGKY